jgi:hypothetical protein
MRGLLAILLVGCTWSSSRDGDVVDDPPPTIRPPFEHDACRSDSACAPGELCARTGTCLPVSEIRAVHVIWTVRGAAADVAACSPAPDFEIDFRSSDSASRLGYAPVPCEQGKFTVDKLPTKFTTVRLSHKGTTDTAGIDAATGNAVFDLAL